MKKYNIYRNVILKIYSEKKKKRERENLNEQQQGNHGKGPERQDLQRDREACPANTRFFDKEER